jgi:hypothetical protein
MGLVRLYSTRYQQRGRGLSKKKAEGEGCVKIRKT